MVLGCNELCRCNGPWALFSHLQEKYTSKKQQKAAKATEIAQRSFLANEDRGGDGPQNNPQGGLGRQDYSRASNADFASLANEMGIDYQDGGLATMFKNKR